MGVQFAARTGACVLMHQQQPAGPAPAAGTQGEPVASDVRHRGGSSSSACCSTSGGNLRWGWGRSGRRVHLLSCARGHSRRRWSPTLAALSFPAGGAANVQYVLAAVQAQDSKPLNEVRPGTLLGGGRYKLTRKLINSKFSTIWLAEDEDLNRKEVVIKVTLGDDKPSYEAALKEIEALEHVNDENVSSFDRAGSHKAASEEVDKPKDVAQRKATKGACDGKRRIVRLLNSFSAQGERGKHAVLVFEKLGDNLGSTMNRFGGGIRLGLPMIAVKSLTRQLLEGLDYLHRDCHVAHLNLRLDNIVLTEPFQSMQDQSFLETIGSSLQSLRRFVSFGASEDSFLKKKKLGVVNELDLHKADCKIIDFARACRLTSEGTPAEPPEGAIIFTTPGYRPPEEILGLIYRTPAYDMWMLGCCVYAMATGQDLFAPQEDERFALNDSHLAEMVGVLGRIPLDLVESSPNRSRYFRKSGRLEVEREFRIMNEPLDKILIAEHNMQEDEALGLYDFLMPLLRYDSATRPTAAEMLQHSWLQLDENSDHDESTFI